MQRLLPLSYFLVLGLVFTVALAWRTAATSDPHGVPPGDIRMVEAWPRAMPDDWPHPTMRITGRGEGLLVVSWRTEGERFYDLTRISAGWPLPAMQWEMWSDHTVNSQYSKDIIVGPPSTWRRGIRMEEPWRALPLSPAWPGLIVNSLLFGGLFALLWFALAGVRQMPGKQPRVQEPVSSASADSAAPESF